MNQADLNRIKIKDLFAAIKKDHDSDSPMGLFLLESVCRREKQALEKATDEDLAEAGKFFVKQKLGIKYYPLQNKKVLDFGKDSKIVPIDQIYG